MPRDPFAIQAGDELIPLDNVFLVNIEEIEKGVVKIVAYGGATYTAEGVDAINAVMLLKPSALEGRRLRWAKHAWAFHNIVAHPVMQVLSWLRFYKTAIWVHDATIPRPTGFKPRS